MKILITGATGFVGHAILPLLIKDGHRIVILTRNIASAQKKLPMPFEFYEWNPEVELPPQEAFANLDAVIHLAGEGIADKRWSAAQKEKIRNSRILGTANLVKGIEKFCQKPLQVFVSTSAIGYYDSSDAQNPLNENSPPASGFLGETCVAWEKQAQQLKNTQRTVIIRVGVVLGESGGALKKLLPIFKLGLGGPIGNGKQAFSWIHQDDLARLYVAATSNAKMQGIINGVAPEPVSNAVFTKALGKALRRPAFFPVPPLALRTAFGEMSEVVLKSQHIVSNKLKDLGFKFTYPNIEAALSHICHVVETGAGKKKVRCEQFLGWQWLPKPKSEVFSFFGDAKNLERITPPWLNFRILNLSTPQIQTGTLIDYKLRVHGIPIHWQTLIETWQENQSFSDSQIKGPYTVWHHTHEFFEYQNGTVILDRVNYKVPFGILGELLALWLVKRDVRNIFAHRQKVVADIFKI